MLSTPGLDGSPLRFGGHHRVWSTVTPGGREEDDPTPVQRPHGELEPSAGLGLALTFGSGEEDIGARLTHHLHAVGPEPEGAA